jgi:uncharacterized spore protein YtfJ
MLKTCIQKDLIESSKSEYSEAIKVVLPLQCVSLGLIDGVTEGTSDKEGTGEGTGEGINDIEGTGEGTSVSSLGHIKLHFSSTSSGVLVSNKSM